MVAGGGVNEGVDGVEGGGEDGEEWSVAEGHSGRGRGR